MASSPKRSVIKARKVKGAILQVIRFLLIFLILCPFLHFPNFSGFSPRPSKSRKSIFIRPPIYLPQATPFQPLYPAPLGPAGDASQGVYVDSLIITISATVITVFTGAADRFTVWLVLISGGQHFSFWILSQRMLPPVVAILPYFSPLSVWFGSLIPILALISYLHRFLFALLYLVAAKLL